MTKTQQLPTEEARKKLGDLLNAAQFAGQHTEITRHGKPAGLLVPADWYETATAAIAEVKALRKELAELRRAHADDTPEG
jgi:prevent-host-death family protein